MAFDFAAAARESGFHTVAPLDPATLRFLPEVRSMCAADRCRSYGANWSCPPACGELDQWRERSAAFDSGLILQTVGEREDSYDIEAMLEAAEENKRQMDRFADRLLASGEPFLLMSAGTCTRCAQCTYPDAPCRFPEKLFPSMEACGLFVSQVCKDNGVAYNYGDEAIAYTCCVLFRAGAREEKES